MKPHLILVLLSALLSVFGGASIVFAHTPATFCQSADSDATGQQEGSAEEDPDCD